MEQKREYKKGDGSQQKGGITKGYKKTCGDDRSVHSLDYSDSFKTYPMVHFKHMKFVVYQLYLNKTTWKK